MSRFLVPFFVHVASLFLAPLASAVIITPPETISTVPVGNAGNAPDGTGLGAVSYNYRIGTYEVTNAQYVGFLNAKAASDPLGLFNTYMESDSRGGIQRGGDDGSYFYTAKVDMADKPVNFVNWFDALRFTNWLHNGQGAGDTESGAYTLLGGIDLPTNYATIARSTTARWGLPTLDEWYKAAYFDPSLNAGLGGYWLFPTQSNDAPVIAVVDSQGNIVNPGANVVNYSLGAEWNGQVGNVTTVGSAESSSYFGTFDQGGNVNEWTESLRRDTMVHSNGGGWDEPPGGLGSSGQATKVDDFFFKTSFNGFRVVYIPEPSSYLLGAFALVGLLAFRRQR